MLKRLWTYLRGKSQKKASARREEPPVLILRLTSAEIDEWIRKQKSCSTAAAGNDPSNCESCGSSKQ